MPTPLFRKGHIPWNKGKKGLYKHTEESKRKIRENNKGAIGKHWELSEETRQKLSEARKEEKSHNWKGGITRVKDYTKNYSKKYVQENYDKALFWNNRRRALKQNAFGSHTFSEWEKLKAQCNWTCLSCKQREPIIKLTEDHIIPLSRGGSDSIKNIQPLCKGCNCRKHAKTIKFIMDKDFKLEEEKVEGEGDSTDEKSTDEATPEEGVAEEETPAPATEGE